MHRIFWVTACVLALFCSTAVSPAAASCLNGTIVTVYQHDGPYRGLYLYTVTLEFILEKGLSNVTLDLGFSDCLEYACGQIFLFADPAGESPGQIEDCAVTYVGEFNCRGNPSIDLTVPVVKWDVSATSDCAPGKTGTATLRFYTNLGPDSNRDVSLFLIKNGQEVCEGTVTGDVPLSPCSVPTRDVRWGEIKSMYQ
jgi:hypothetical protein